MNILNLSNLLGRYGIHIVSYKSTYITSANSANDNQIFNSKLKIREIRQPLADQRLEEDIIILQALLEAKDTFNPTIKDAYEQLKTAIALTKAS